MRQIEDLKQLEHNFSVTKCYFAEYKNFKLLPSQVIPINIDQHSFNLLCRLYASGGLLSQHLSVSEGLRIPSNLESKIPRPGNLRIVKQYQFSKYSKIRLGSFINSRNFKKILSHNSVRYQKIFSPKILIAEDALQITATLDLDKFIPQGGVYFATPLDDNLNIQFLLGLLNSSLLSYLYELLYAGMHMGGGYLRYRSKFIENLPLPQKLNFTIVNKIDKAVNKILSLTQTEDYLPAATSTAQAGLENPQKQAKVKEYEKQIDEMVYKLYGLTKEEIKIVEERIHS